MNKLNYRCRSKCIHRVFGQVESTDYFCDRHSADDCVKEVANCTDIIGVVYVERWTGKEWKKLSETHI